MSIRSKVKRQVRRNAREAPKARARRLTAARWQWAMARWPSAAAIHTASMSTMLAADAKAWRKMFAFTILPDSFMVMPDGAKIEILSVDMGAGGTVFEDVRREADAAITRAILGRTS